MENTTVETDQSQIVNMIALKQVPSAFSDLIKGIQQINDPLNELAASPSAVVFSGFPCCDCKLCFTCCVCDSCCVNCKCECCKDKIFLYNTAIKTGQEQKFLFKNLAYVDCCGLDIDCRFKKIEDRICSSTNDYSLNNGTVFSEAVNTGCTCCGLCGLYLNVSIPNQNRLAGVVKFRGKCEEWFCCPDCCKTECCSCYDYYYCCEILDHNKDNVYNIYARRCCLSCVPLGCCGNIEFAIKNQSGTTVGEIICDRDCCPCFGICGYKSTFNIDFPVDCTPEIKLTIINAIIAVDLLCL
jgi:hypothetical protein